MSAKISKAQFRELNGCHVGVGFLMLKTRANEVMRVDFYTSPKGELRRVANGKPLLPITIVDEDKEGNPIEIVIGAASSSVDAIDFGISFVRVCDHCDDEKKEAFPYCVKDRNGKHWGDLCNDCFDLLGCAYATSLPAGPDPNCQNCDGSGGALPGGRCGMCWTKDGDE